MAELDDFPEVDKDKHAEDHEVHHVELKACCCANLVASPGGCCGMFWLVIACWIGCGVYIAFNIPCLSTNFSDLKVVNSDISNNWYQKGLSGENAYEYVMSMCLLYIYKYTITDMTIYIVN